MSPNNDGIESIDIKVNRIILYSSIAAGVVAIFLSPIPGSSGPILAAIELFMVYKIAQAYEYQLTFWDLRRWWFLFGVIIVWFGRHIAGIAAHIIPFFGNAIVAVGFIVLLGKLAPDYFVKQLKIMQEQGLTFEDRKTNPASFIIPVIIVLVISCILIAGCGTVIYYLYQNLDLGF